MRIHRDDFHPRTRAKLAPPPNYGSRKVQFRLLTMIFAFAAVIWLMNEARKPENWRFFTALEQQGEQADVPRAGPEPDTRVEQRPLPDYDPPGLIRLGTAEEVAEQELPAPETATDARSLAHFDAWRQALAVLDLRQRRVFARMMLVARGRAALEPENAELRREIIAKLDTQWSAYLQQALQAVVEQSANLTDDEKSNWVTIIQQMQSNWEQELKPALLSISAGGELSEKQRELLDQAQQVIDRVDLAAITDNSIYRPTDEHAWFRLLEKLADASPRQLTAETIPAVGFIELFEQPDNYRGELVRVAGEVKMAKRVRPPANALGIDEYYMFWLRPDGSNSPLAIYSLEVPAEFPEIGREETMLSTRASFTGYFFKRWVYPAFDGPRIAPVLLAKSPVWTPEPESAAPLQLTAAMGLLLIGGATVLGIGVAVVVYRTARHKSSLSSPYNTAVQQAPERLAVLEQQPAPLTVGERLERHMSGDSGTIESGKRGDKAL